MSRVTASHLVGGQRVAAVLQRAAAPEVLANQFLALRRARMPQLEQWARMRARTTCPVRRGAWYRVVQLTPTEAVLDVNRQPFAVPRPFLQILPIRPRMWSVVLRSRGSTAPPQSWGPRYAVCPRCCARAPLPGQSVSMRCPGCDMAFVIAWSDSHWRVFELLSGSPAARGIAKARDAAVRLWKGSAARRFDG